jgi:predicted ATPase
LAALFQTRVQSGRVALVAIEEPETALHPAGVGALYEALHDAARRTQVIVTSQSSDLLDNEYADLAHIRAVANVDGATVIGEVDQAGRAIVDKKLMSLSELHRSGQMRPELPSRPPAPDGGTG